MVALILLISIMLSCTNGQLLSHLFPISNNITEDLVNKVVKNPILFDGSEIQANILKEVTKVPLKLARVLEPVPMLFYSSSESEHIILQKFFVELKAGARNEDAILNFEGLVTKYNREFKSYEVMTKDGYILSLFRIRGTGTPAFLMHGLLGSADDFIIAGPDSGLAYILAEEGYDVWLGNARGNKYSRRHATMDASEAVFWDFSWHEIGVNDLPTMIDFVLETTDQRSLKYIGHSQGTTAFFVMASERPAYNSKVSLMIALSPVAFMGKVRAPIVRLLSPGTFVLQGLSNGLGIYEFLPDSQLVKLLKFLVCGTGTIAEIVCTNTMFWMFGFDFAQLNVTNLPVIFSHVPSGASMKQLVHYGQGVITEDFRHFDYGAVENIERYGSMVPPRYPLENVVTPISLFYSESDWLADPRDVERLSQELKNVVDAYDVPFEKFNHVDFILAKDVRFLVYKRVIEIMTTY